MPIDFHVAEPLKQHLADELFAADSNTKWGVTSWHVPKHIIYYFCR